MSDLGTIPPVRRPTEPETRELDRLIDAEERDRDERRGIEDRATALIAASMVALGLVLNAATQLAIGSGGVWGALGLISLALSSLALVFALGLLAVRFGPQFYIPDPGKRDIPSMAEESPQEAISEARSFVNGLRERNKKKLRALQRVIRALALAVVFLVVGGASLLIGSKISTPPTGHTQGHRTHRTHRTHRSHRTHRDHGAHRGHGA
jgi:hypothetical protein